MGQNISHIFFIFRSLHCRFSHHLINNEKGQKNTKDSIWDDGTKHHILSSWSSQHSIIQKSRYDFPTTDGWRFIRLKMMSFHVTLHSSHFLFLSNSLVFNLLLLLLYSFQSIYIVSFLSFLVPSSPPLILHFFHKRGVNEGVVCSLVIRKRWQGARGWGKKSF